MTPNQIVMFVCAVLLFLTALVCLVTRRSGKLVTPLLSVSVIMIGFPSIKSFKLMEAEVELNRDLDPVGQEPNDPTARNRLASRAAWLSKQGHLALETRVVLSKAQFALGQDKEAAPKLRAALKEKLNLQVSRTYERRQTESHSNLCV